MKCCIKVFAFLFLGLFISVLFYPFLHESGHALAAKLVGVECLEFHLLPMPYVLCDMTNAGKTDYYIIGFAGTTFPFVFSQILRPFCRKKIFVKFSVFFIEGITLLACVISLVSVFILQYGFEYQQDDVVNVLIGTNAGPVITKILFLILLFSAGTIITVMVKQKTVKSMFEFLVGSEISDLRT